MRNVNIVQFVHVYGVEFYRCEFTDEFCRGLMVGIINGKHGLVNGRTYVKQ